MEKAMKPLIKDSAAEATTVQLRAEIEQTRKEHEQFRRSASKCRQHMNYRQAVLFDRRRRELAMELKALLLRLDKEKTGQ